MSRKELPAQPTADQCELFLDHLSDIYEVSKIAGSPHASDEVLRLLAETDFGSEAHIVLAAIASNPRVPEDLIIKIMSQATKRVEWFAVHKYWLQRYGSLGPNDESTEASGFPEELLSGTVLEDENKYRLFLNIMSRFAEHMWQDLGSRNLLELNFWDDHSEGSLFGPLFWVGNRNEQLLYRMLGQGYFTTWATWSGSVDAEEALENLAEYALEYLEDEDWQDDLSSDNPFPASLVMHMAALGEDEGDLVVLRTDLLQSTLNEVMEGSETMFDYTVTITDQTGWASPSWEGLSPAERKSFVDNLISTLSHPFLGGWGFSENLLALIAIHPSTENHIKAQLNSLAMPHLCAAMQESGWRP